ncbi:histidine--tRNA ligase [Woeseia oceani]|uniref:Histidine--tRNA ligase n=1 Tax=Woeseia oceani TaxID=1548547 RepID=A0A193LKS4_9GAMM|nr:histidine--tRNA ligase [Woeseia oceani]ANO53041.1 histidine--tRNA ligase [Woeseia oceani]
MNDVLPEDAVLWRHLETIVRELVESYGYREIRLPVVEFTELFKRSIGEVTDIVEKEMYTFLDRNGESLTLRPEGTAGMVRAGITNSLLHNQRQKLWMTGPMFRYEKPQKGRYRQFHQMDVEALGYAGPDVDAELIIMCARMWQRLGISQIRLEINSLGNPESRALYREELVSYFSAVKNRLDEDSIRRLEQNPLRILDSKNPDMQEIVAGAPVMVDYLDDESAQHFATLKTLIAAAGVEFTVNPRLVRGLDYYNRTVFEWVTDVLGSQGAVCSGGRYDGLVEKLGGKPTPAIGWAMGIERLVALYAACGGEVPEVAPDVYVVTVGEQAATAGFQLVEGLRDALPACAIELNMGGGSFKSQLKRADKSGAAYAVILGDDEVSAGQAGLKPLRSDEDQTKVPQTQLAGILAQRLG